MGKLLCLIGLHRIRTNPRMRAFAPWMEKCERCGLHPWVRREMKSPATAEERKALLSAGVPEEQIP